MCNLSAHAPTLRLAFLVPCLSTAACSAAESGGPGASVTDSPEIQGGTDWGGDYAVGMLKIGTSGVCTGTLIAPNIVLTAGHCVDTLEPVTGFYLGRGAKMFAQGDDIPEGVPEGMEFFEVEGTALRPGFDLDDAVAAHRCPMPEGDIALVKLKTNATTGGSRKFPPRPYQATDPTTTSRPLAVGQRCWIVGYGRHDEGTGSGQKTSVMEKRTAAVIVKKIDEHGILVERADDSTGGISDTGDSGGPLLCFVPGETVVGVTSCHTDGTYPNHHQTWYARVDRAAEFVGSSLASFPPPRESCAQSMQGRCTGNTLEYCTGRKWKTMQACGAGTTCDAAAMRCR